jgi:hypothetical protein
LNEYFHFNQIKEDCMLTSEQLYELTNVYNTGAALGFAGAFAAGSFWKDMDIAYSQARGFWPGGPLVSLPGALGAAITYDKKPLPPFLWNPPPNPRTFPGTFEFMRDNERRVIQILINRTPYAHYASFGSLLGALQVNARDAMVMKYPTCMTPWNIAMQILDTLIPFANDICRPAENDWRTPIDVTALRELRTTMSQFSGPNVIEVTFQKQGIGNVGGYLYKKCERLLTELEVQFHSSLNRVCMAMVAFGPSGNAPLTDGFIKATRSLSKLP